MKVTFKIKKRTRVLGNIVACFLFIMLAIYGWDLPVSTALLYLGLCVGFLIVIMVVAAGLGWCLMKLRSSNQSLSPPHGDHPAKNDDKVD